MSDDYNDENLFGGGFAAAAAPAAPAAAAAAPAATAGPPAAAAAPAAAPAAAAPGGGGPAGGPAGAAGGGGGIGQGVLIGLFAVCGILLPILLFIFLIYTKDNSSEEIYNVILGLFVAYTVIGVLTGLFDARFESVPPWLKACFTLPYIIGATIGILLGQGQNEQFEFLNKLVPLENGGRKIAGGLTLVSFVGSIALFFGLIGGLMTNVHNKNHKVVDNIAITLASLVGISIFFYFFRYDIRIYIDDNTFIKVIKTLVSVPLAIPYLFTGAVMDSLTGLTGENSFGGNATLDKVNEKYNGRINQIRNLGKSDSGYIFLNYFKYNKRESILPCKTAGVKGVCQVRRSVIYMVFYLAAVLLIPLFVTLGNIKDNDNKFNREEYIYWLTWLLVITFGLEIFFVLGTVKSYAGSDIYEGSKVKAGDDVDTVLQQDV